jgi:[protein-PII] uridylyltransferase
MSISQACREPESLAKTWRHHLHQQQAQLRAAFEGDADTTRLLKAHCLLVDDLLCDIWQQSDLAKDVCLIAVGGYGRGELFPYSDVDLLVLLPKHLDHAINKRIESVVGLLWDIGLAVGHSVRNLSECVDEAGKDVTVQTNLLEARFLVGNNQLYQEFQGSFRNTLHPQIFFEAKTQEQHQRHARFNDTAYNLEPNVKESPGGLRDLQTILWITRSIGIGDNWAALVKEGIISQPEARQIRRHERHLQMLRIRLHYLANRREDRLIFDFQNDLAAQLGFNNNAHKRASEQLMHGFYRSAKFTSWINEILLQALRERIYPELHDTVTINARFEARNGLLEISSPAVLQRDPSAIMESFLLLEQHPELTGMSANLLRTLHRVKKMVNREFREDAENKRLFLEILDQPVGVTSALRRMNHYGVLGRYIPAFGRIVGQMQHDLFHVYTVDEHILNVLGNLRRFALAQFAHEFPLCSRLFVEFDAPHLLYLGALFHDIAKGRGGDHSTLGMTDAKRFCKMHGLPKADGELVAWLVQSHLTMSSVAQKCDLSDPAVIKNFASLMGSERRLTALYLLTVADIRGTSPKVWNAWKAKLLENLFYLSRRLLRGAAVDGDSELHARQLQATSTLNHYGISKTDYGTLWEKLGRQYFMRHESPEIAWHTRLLLTHINAAEPIIRARLSPGGEGIQVMIYTQDRDDLFAHICGFFERIGYTILEAKVHTSGHGYALDTFLVLDQNDKSVSYRDLLNYIEYELTQKLLSGAPPEVPAQRRVSRQVKHMPIQADITITLNNETRNYVMEIIASDRPGLLLIIAHAFLKHGVRLHTAKINTLGNRAEDTFLISASDNNKLNEAVAIDTLKIEALKIEALKDDLLTKI